MARTEHADAVVVGSGFGGSVAAFRLAEAGSSVVVLERGQAYAPGDFPRSPTEMGRAFWDPSEGLYGMFDVWSFKGCDSVVASGLGGGSLIYANVLLRKDERWFVNDKPGGGYEPWPVDRADLEEHYERVEEMLGASPYPLDHAAFADTPKTHAMQDAAAELGLKWGLPPLAVSFAPERGGDPGLGLPIAEPSYGNYHGEPRRTCRLCGECDIGCNDGAKNSLDHNYLSAAKFHGADIRTSHEVKAVRPRPGGGYEVDYVEHDAQPIEPDGRGRRKTRKLPVRTITCDRLILGAGTYGTTYLLLKSRKNFPGLSPALGTRFCGNGDLLTFLLKARDRNRVRPLDASRGPVITSAIRLPDDLDGHPGAGRGAYIEDGGYPAFLDWMVQPFDVGDQIERMVKFLWSRFADFISGAPDTNLSKELSDLIGDGALSVSSLPLLGMGRDTPDGRLALSGGRLTADWTSETSMEHFKRLRRTMQGIADVLGAEYADNPMWFRKRVVTVHPLGGAPMGHDPVEGVCDAFGEVFGFPGLFIADGAAMPGPVGPNPSLTIAALADRMAARILDGQSQSRHNGGRAGLHDRRDRRGGERGDVRLGDLREDGGSSAGEPGRTSLSFTEEMKGFVTYGATDPRAGELDDDRVRLSFRLTITADDAERFLAEPEHTARAEGWIDFPGRGGRRPVQRGWFNLFAPGGADDRRLMKYRLFFADERGRPCTLTGQKNVLHGPPTRIWPDTSTLYARVLEGHVEDEDQDEKVPTLAAGVLHIKLTDFARQLTTFRTTGPDGTLALANFGKFFAGELWEVYGPDLD